MMLIAIAMLRLPLAVLTRTRIGLVIQAALTHPQMAEALGHDVQRVFMLVFAGGAALAGLAGVIGGTAFVTHLRWPRSVGPIVFVVVVVGGMGSLAGAFIASLLIGLIQTFAIADRRFAWPSTVRHARRRRASVISGSSRSPQLAPIIPYLLMVAC